MASEWTGGDFIRAIDNIRAGKQLTSREWNSLADALNQRITSGLGDCSWRIAWCFYSFWRDLVSTNKQFQYPRSDEAFAHWLILNDGYTDETIFDGDRGRTPNRFNPMLVFRDGRLSSGGSRTISATVRDWDGKFRSIPIRGEKRRFQDFAVSRTGSDYFKWKAMYRRRGRITDAQAQHRTQRCASVTHDDGTTEAIQIKDQDLYGFPRHTLTYNAREILQVPRQISGFYGWLKSFGGRIIPTSAPDITCDDASASTPVNTPVGNKGGDGDFPEVPVVKDPEEGIADRDTPALPPETVGDGEDDPFSPVNGSYQDDYLNQSGVNTDAPAYDYFQHARGTQYEAMMAAFCAEFRGLNPIGDPSVYRIRESAFDFDRFFQSQYLCAPARDSTAIKHTGPYGNVTTIGYPALTTTKSVAATNFVIGGIMFWTGEERNDEGSRTGNLNPIDEGKTISILVRTEIEGGITKDLTITLDNETTSKSRFFPSGAIQSVQVIGSVTTDADGNQTTSAGLPDGILGEYYEAFKMLPKLYDAYALLRVVNSVPEGNQLDKPYSDDYFRWGASFGGAFSDAEKDTSLELFPPYRSMKRFTNSLMRLMAFDRLVGYETISEPKDIDNPLSEVVQKSVLYFHKDGRDTSGFDIFHGMHGKRVKFARPAGQTSEWVFGFAGSCPADGDDDNQPGKSQAIFKLQSYAQIRGSFVSPHYLFSYCMSKPYASRAERDALPIVSPLLRARRKNFGFILRGQPTDGLGISRFQLFPEAPSGLAYRYGEDPKTQGFTQEQQTQYFQANNIHQAPYLVDDVSVLEGDEFYRKFPVLPGRISGAGSNPKLYTRGSRVTSLTTGQVIKVKLNRRLNATERGQTQPVSNTGASWNAYSKHDTFRDRNNPNKIIDVQVGVDYGGGGATGDTQFRGIRSDENRIIELLQYVWNTYDPDETTMHTYPERRIGDFSPSASGDRQSIARRMWGSVFSRFYFVKLVPKGHIDDNNTWQSSDTKIYSHLFRQCDFYIRAIVCAFFDPDSNNQSNLFELTDPQTQIKYCTYGFPPRDYIMERLVSARSGIAPNIDENLAMQKLAGGNDPSKERVRRINGFGPLPNMDFTSGMFIEMAKVVNALIGCSIPGVFNEVRWKHADAGGSCPSPDDLGDEDCERLSGNGCEIFTEGCLSGNWTDADCSNVGNTGQHPTQVFYNRAGKEASSGNRPHQDVPYRATFTINNPGTPAGDLDEEWSDGVSGAVPIVFGASANWGLSPDNQNRIYKVSGDESYTTWQSLGSEEFLHAFSNALREYVNQSSFGRPVLIIQIMHIQGSLYAVCARSDFNSTIIRRYGRAHVEEEKTAVGCKILTGGTPRAPALPGTCQAAATNFTFMQNNPTAAFTIGGHSSGLNHNIGPVQESVLVINVKGGDEFIDEPDCIPATKVAEGGPWYEVLGGDGIMYGHPAGQGGAPIDGIHTYKDGTLFQPVYYQPTAGRWKVVENWTQVNTDNPSRVCRRPDIKPGPEDPRL